MPNPYIRAAHKLNHARVILIAHITGLQGVEYHTRTVAREIGEASEALQFIALALERIRAQPDFPEETQETLPWD